MVATLITSGWRQLHILYYYWYKFHRSNRCRHAGKCIYMLWALGESLCCDLKSSYLFLRWFSCTSAAWALMSSLSRFKLLWMSSSQVALPDPCSGLVRGLQEILVLAHQSTWTSLVELATLAKPDSPPVARVPHVQWVVCGSAWFPVCSSPSASFFGISFVCGSQRSLLRSLLRNPPCKVYLLILFRVTCKSNTPI